MSILSPSKAALLYNQFRRIQKNEYQIIIHFFEKHEEFIRQLDFQQHNEIFLAYIQSLFETGAYRKFISFCDDALMLVLEDDIPSGDFNTLYQQLLFQKGASYYQLGRFQETAHIMTELVRMEPEVDFYQHFLCKCLRRINSGFVKKAKALSVFLFLFATTVVFIEVIVIRPFLPDLIAEIEPVRNALFLIGVGALFGSDLLHRLKVHLKVRQMVRRL